MKYQGIPMTDLIRIEELYSLHYFEYMNSFYFPGESHPFWEFVCVDKGDVTIGAGDRSFLLRRGQIAFHEPGEFHWVRAGGGAAPNLIVISFSCASQVMDFFRGRILSLAEADRRLLARIVSEARICLEGRLDDPWQTSLTLREDTLPGSLQIIRTCLEQLLIGLYRRYNRIPARTASTVSPLIPAPGANSPGPAEERERTADVRSLPAKDKLTKENADSELFTRITDYLTENLSAHLTIEDICRDHLISRSRLQKLFQARCGKGIIEYYSSMKIDAAKQLIRDEEMNFTQISEHLGYSSIHYFSRQFKKITGMTPSEYASSIKAMSERTPGVTY